MKYLKKFERLEEYPFEIGDYVKLDDDSMSWVYAGIYGKINNTIFKISRIDSDGNYYLDELEDWFRRNQLEKATPEEIENNRLKQTSDKYNL